MESTAHAGSGSPGTVQLSYLESGVALIAMGTPEERIITLTPARIESLRECIRKLAAERPKGLVICSASPEMFTAGADITLIQSVTDRKVGAELARAGQAAFAEIEALPFSTVAAISGPCVGGGCELVLACSGRVITEHKSSTIGLPEIRLGILPGFGGTQRLPRLVGIRRALDIILAGKTIKPKQARSAGLVDAVVPDLPQALKLAEAMALKKPRRRKVALVDRLLGGTSLGRLIVKSQAETKLARETKGFYPAPPRALDTILFGLEHGTVRGYEKEAEELGTLIVTPESKALVNMFFLTEGSKGLGKGARKQVEEIRAVVVGAGVMGAGIAGVLARQGAQVVLKDTTDQALQRGKAQISGYVAGLRGLSESERSFIVNRVETTTKDSPQIAHANFAIEAVFESLDLKRTLFTDLSKTLPSDALLASNTSSLSITEIGSGVPGPERVIGMHFFNPVEKMPLVEVIRGRNTSDRAIITTCALAVKLGKFPIVVEDVPGFLVNRILSPYLVEAAHLLSEGYEIADIDRAATRFGMPMGPIRLLDEVGLDVASHVSEIMVAGYGDRMSGPGYAKVFAQKGRLGKKSRHGFYRFLEKDAMPSTDVRTVLEITAAPRAGDETVIADRLIMSLVNEAVLCLDEGVAGQPSKEAANQIDLGSVMGFGFPPFRGGLLYYADTLGAKKVLETMNRLSQSCGARFQAAPGIAQRAQSGRSFHTAV